MFAKGNNYWQFRNKHGRDFKYDPELLWNEFIDYSKWLEDNPLQEEKVFCFKGEVTRVPIAKMRAMTLKGFCIFADIDTTTFENYRENKDFFRVTRAIDDAIITQKFEGAAAELLNPNIIARDLGLADVTKEVGKPSVNIHTTAPEEVNKLLANLHESNKDV